MVQRLNLKNSHTGCNCILLDLKMTEPIFTLDLFPKLNQKLIELLRSLSTEEWQMNTVSPQWNVHDIALHLLDGNIKTLSMLRDHYYGVNQDDIHSYGDLVTYLNQLNNEWVDALKRVSPGVLIDLLTWTGAQYYDYLKSLDPFATAPFSVAWAGEEQSANWFHIAREYTEKWHHQQQIRLAVGKEEALYTKEFYFPYLDTSMRALPYHYRNQKSKKPETLQFIISGEGGSIWYLQYLQSKWNLVDNPEDNITGVIKINGPIAWRIFTKSINQKQALNEVEVTGDKASRALCLHILEMLAVMA